MTHRSKDIQEIKKSGAKKPSPGTTVTPLAIRHIQKRDSKIDISRLAPGAQNNHVQIQ